MKKFFALILVMLLTFCGCQVSISIDDDFPSQFGSNASIGSIISNEEYTVTPYKAKENYKNASAGFSYF